MVTSNHIKIKQDMRKDLVLDIKEKLLKDKKYIIKGLGTFYLLPAVKTKINNRKTVRKNRIKFISTKTIRDYIG